MTKDIAKNLVHTTEIAFYKNENKCEEALPKHTRLGPSQNCRFHCFCLKGQLTTKSKTDERLANQAN